MLPYTRVADLCNLAVNTVSFDRPVRDVSIAVVIHIAVWCN